MRDISIEQLQKGAYQSLAWCNPTVYPETIFFIPLDQFYSVERLRDNPDQGITIMNRISGAVYTIPFFDLIVDNLSHETIHIVIDKLGVVDVLANGRMVDYFQSKGVLQ